MSRAFYDLKDVAFAAGQNSGGLLQLSQVPPNTKRGENYVSEIVFRLVGTITANGSGFSLNDGEITTLIDRIMLQVNNLRPFVNQVRGLDLHRMYALRNKGDVPAGTSAISAAANAVVNVDFAVICQFGDPSARKYQDGHIPARLLKDATLTVSFANLSAVHANIASASLTLKTVAVAQPRREVVIPSLASIEASDFVTGDTQPAIPKSQGKVSHLMVAKQRSNGSANNGFATSDLTTLGLRYGDDVVSNDTLPTGQFYKAFAEWATTDFTDHTSTTGKIAEGIPLQFPPLGLNGQHTSYELADARDTWRLKADAVGTAYTMIRREIWTPGPWLNTVREKLNIGSDAKFKAKTASHKGLAPEAADGLPLKQIG